MTQSSIVLKMEKQVHRYIKTRNLLIPGDRIVVAVSGGPDSVALLACLVALSERWNWGLSLGHVNHGLRGAESEEDADFVVQLGSHFGIPAHVREVRIRKQDAKLTQQSFQAYARAARYHALKDIAQEYGATKIATGHTADDQAETVLMWMLRGSGTGGLGGIPPKRGGGIVRPLLDIPRNDIIDYLAKRQLPYRVDSSNNQPVYLRNRLRQDLMPHLKVYSPGIVHILSRQAEILREDHAYLEDVAVIAYQQACVSEDEHGIQLDRMNLLAWPMAMRRRVVRHCLQKMHQNTPNPRFDTIQRVLDCVEQGQSGWTIPINGVDVGQEYDRLVFSKKETMAFNNSSASPFREMSVNIPGEIVWPPTGQRLAVSMKYDQTSVSQPHSLAMEIDTNTFTPELRVRSWMPGDVFCPKGLGGRQKKLQDFFSDIKLPRSQREKVPLLVAPEGILWVGGLREDERFQPSSTTTSIVIATMTP
ncbi:MAG: tRNA lysidine(34) synthetase TilS [Nitrospirales bacterium]